MSNTDTRLRRREQDRMRTLERRRGREQKALMRAAAGATR